MRRRTLNGPFRLEGVGVHSGRPGAVTVRPGTIGGGLFVRFGEGPLRPLSSARWSAGERRSGLTFGKGERLETAEHLLAALWGLGVTDAVIEPEGMEVPILDGSALPWVEAVFAVGVVESDAEIPAIVPVVPIDASDPNGARTLVLLPSDRLVCDYTIDYPGTPIGCRRIALAISPESFAERVAPARTFGLASEAAGLRERGLALGASLENSLVFAPGGILNPGGERIPEEPPAHKVLDLLGDLALLGCPLLGRLVAVGAGHDLHQRLVSRILRATFGDSGTA